MTPLVTERLTIREFDARDQAPELNGRSEIELDYRLARDCWGLGLATEAGTAVLDAAASCWRLDPVTAIIARRHVASVNLARKLGGVRLRRAIPGTGRCHSPAGLRSPAERTQRIEVTGLVHISFPAAQAC